MMVTDQEFSCCKNPPKYRMTYSVAGTEKVYLVCKVCAELECFRKFIVTQEDVAPTTAGRKRNGS